MNNVGMAGDSLAIVSSGQYVGHNALQTDHGTIQSVNTAVVHAGRNSYSLKWPISPTAWTMSTSQGD